ncbi:MAG: FdtA/QdtA family cupin domain-containing protein [Proteobacteria bacterium]|nr:FdtA/QdtA family cupin domain-containing protein [Pseudomonadota bacterium]
MAHIIELPTRTDSRGSLTVLEKALPFQMKRLYWIYDLNHEPRGKHRHKTTWQGMICLQGECEVLVKKEQQEHIFVLNKPNEVLILEPQDWHEMRAFKQTPILLVVASEYFDADDYINEPL